jgi:hypothetical protein
VPFNLSFNSPDQKATVYLGHPLERRSHLHETTKQWFVVVPDTASLEGGMLKWVKGNQIRWMSAEEVFSLAQEESNGFQFSKI